MAEPPTLPPILILSPDIVQPGLVEDHLNEANPECNTSTPSSAMAPISSAQSHTETQINAGPLHINEAPNTLPIPAPKYAPCIVMNF